MKQAIIVAALMMATSPAFATDTSSQGTQTGQNFDQVKAEAVEHINGRISRAQQELSCVKAAKTNAEIKACSQKFKEEARGQQQQNIEQQQERQRIRQERRY